jgi:hypothetical protein
MVPALSHTRKPSKQETKMSLLEISNVERFVDIRGKKIAVTGVSALGIAQMMARFPEFGKMLSGATVDSMELAKMAPRALNAFIAAGCGNPANEEAEKIAGNLGVGEQLELIDEILRLTFPRGVGPFVEKLKGMGVLNALDKISGEEEQPAASPQTSQPPLKNSSQPGT